MEKLRTPMTWANLKNLIESMPEEQLNEPVKVWSEFIPLQTDVVFDCESEDLYYHDDFDYCYPESELEDYSKEECTLVLEKGKYFLSY